MKCNNHDELDICQYCCYTEHWEDEITCIYCYNWEYGGNWKRWLLCSWLGHRWHHVYSYVGYCERCFRGIAEKDY